MKSRKERDKGGPLTAMWMDHYSPGSNESNLHKLSKVLVTLTVIINILQTRR